MVALSATPASDLVGAQAVISNLLISHLEVRTEDSKDIREFSNHRDIETIVVRLDPQLAAYKRRLCDLALKPLQRLADRQALWHRGEVSKIDPETFAPFTLVKSRETFAKEHRYSPLASAIYNDFKIAICLTRAIQLLVQYGLRPVYLFLLGNLNGEGADDVPDVKELVSELGAALGVSDCATAPLSQRPFVTGHPKLFKLRDILLEHFSYASANEVSHGGTRAIVFTQFRDSVAEIMHMLKAHSPLLRPVVFVGQSAGEPSGRAGEGSRAVYGSLRKKNTQRDQLRVMEEFREGRVNILISTCVGEEGLDVGQVDLIVCFDAHKSPARLVQRVGRTGRKRSGRVVVLLTEGREQSNFALSMARSKTVHQSLIRGAALKQLHFYPHNPRMVPLGLHPVPVPWIPEAREPTPPKSSLTLTRSCSRTATNPFLFAIMENWKKHRLSTSQISLSLFEYSPLLSIGEMMDKARNLFSEHYSSRRHLDAMRENFQSTDTGPSASTWHLVSLLRLMELHRKGRTHAMFHATGMRNVDMSCPLSELLPSSMSQMTQSQATVVPSQTLPCSSSPVNPSPVRFFRGLISGEIMADPHMLRTDVIRFPDTLPPSTEFTLANLRRAIENVINIGLVENEQKDAFGVELSPCPRKRDSVIFDLAFGLPAPLENQPFFLQSPRAEKRRRTVENCVAESPKENSPESNECHHRTTEQSDILFDAKLQFDDELEDFLQTA